MSTFSEQWQLPNSNVRFLLSKAWKREPRGRGSVRTERPVKMRNDQAICSGRGEGESPSKEMIRTKCLISTRTLGTRNRPGVFPKFPTIGFFKRLLWIRGRRGLQSSMLAAEIGMVFLKIMKNRLTKDPLRLMAIKMDDRQELIFKPILVLLASNILSAATIALNKKVLEDGLDVLVLITYRLLVAALFIAPIAFFFERFMNTYRIYTVIVEAVLEIDLFQLFHKNSCRNSRPKLSFGILACLFLSAILGNSLTQYLFYLGLKLTSATYAAAFFNMTPVITFLLSLLFRQETLNFRSWAGLAKLAGTAVNLGGGMMLTLYKGMVLIKSPKKAGLADQTLAVEAMHESKRWVMGSVALLLGCFSWALWFPLQSNIGRRYRALYSATAIVFFFSFLQTALIGLSTQKSFSIWILRSKFQIVSILYGGIVGSGMCFLVNSWCVEKRGPVFAIAFFPFAQVAVAIIDVSLLHEQLHLGSLLGSIVIISGLYILLWGKSKEALASSSSETGRLNSEVATTGP